jgi:rod shape-determining protein MreB
VSAEEAHRAIREQVQAIGDAVRSMLDQSPPELATDIVDHGVVLTGGGSQLKALPAALRDATGLAVVRAEQPASAVVVGAGRILEEMDLLRAVAC